MGKREGMGEKRKEEKRKKKRKEKAKQRNKIPLFFKLLRSSRVDTASIIATGATSAKCLLINTCDPLKFINASIIEY
jgi:hypothetical protein